MDDKGETYEQDLREANELTCKARQLGKKGFFSFWTRDKSDDIIQCYSLASNKYKLCHKWKEAAECLLKKAELHKDNDEESYQASSIFDAATIMKKYDMKEAINYMSKAAGIYGKIGRFAMSGKCEKNAADMFMELRDYENASVKFKKAAYYFEMDEYSTCNYSKCRLSYAEVIAQYCKKYTEAILIFEEEAAKSLKNQLLKYGAKDLYIKAGILHIVEGDMVNAQICIDNYSTNDDMFSDSQEKVLLDSIIKAINENDETQYQEAVTEYESIRRLCPWVKCFLNIIEKRFQVEGNVELTQEGHVDLT